MENISHETGIFTFRQNHLIIRWKVKTYSNWFKSINSAKNPMNNGLINVN